MNLKSLDRIPDRLAVLGRLAEALAGLLSQVMVFPEGHPAIMPALKRLESALNIAIGAREGITLSLFDGCICSMNFRVDLMDNPSRSHRQLLSALRAMSVSEIGFSRGTERDELLAFSEIMACALKGDRRCDISSKWMRISGIEVRYCSSGGAEPRGTGRRRPGCRPVAGNLEDYAGIGHDVGSVLEGLEKIQSLDGRRAAGKILELIENGRRNSKVILLLKSLKDYDEYTFSHSVNVATISAALADHAALSPAMVETVSMAALMHDIGKIYVPRSILKKAGRLTPAEWQVIKKHPVDGERILREDGLDPVISRIALEHHMRYDMKGYPSSSGTVRLHECSHLVRIADTYDALTTLRAYRKQLSPYEAIRMMSRSRGTEFHPGYFDRFTHMMGNIPLGAVVTLKSGETALVVDVMADTGPLPRVRLLKDASGRDIEEEVIIDLNETDPVLKRYTHPLGGICEGQGGDVDIGIYPAGKRR